MDTRSFLMFRLTALVLAFGYWIYQFSTTDYSAFGWQFRFLTNWGQTSAFFAFAVLSLWSWRGETHRYHSLFAAIAVMNILVVFLYWRLYFIDPALLYGDKERLAWFQEYYLHLLGPLLIVFDALFLTRAFDKIIKGVLITIGFCITYSLWIEMLVRPLNDDPIGEHATGLPYAFLNDMVISERINFYATTIATALAFFALSWLLGWLSKRFLPTIRN